MANSFEFFIQDGKNTDLGSLFRYRSKMHFKDKKVSDKLRDSKEYKSIENMNINGHNYWVYVFEDKEPEIINEVYTGTSRIEKKVKNKTHF